MPHVQHLRRKDRSISPDETEILLQKGEYCVLASVNADCRPYATPLSYIFLDGKIYFHSAHEGHKIANLRENAHCSLAVVGSTQPVYQTSFSTFYESAIVFGTAAEVTEPAEKTRILLELARKYLPEHMDKAAANIAASLHRTAVYSISIETVTGKAKKK